MKNSIALIAATFCFLLSSCHRPVAYFQPTPHPAAARLSVDKPTTSTDTVPSDSVIAELPQLAVVPEVVTSVSIKSGLEQTTNTQVERRIRRIQSLLGSSTTETTDKQPEPKPKKKLKLGNRIRESLGMPLRKELNWWQRISWKLKASVIVLLVAVLFAILHITILAIIFGILGAFLLITGLKRSFKVRRPWF
ncbi:hypothetical protein [Spirosoma validum]|uniref:DUF4349 domain-containing protein n=1 Tax=Spirosoma validum TaxID=2771355 RepID=A0A927GFR6_9BACT|nr:hypothetical protein [Spirosoma validum]MBD2756099.1 hypothetical protein [Spirosoma validum]